MSDKDKFIHITGDLFLNPVGDVFSIIKSVGSVNYVHEGSIFTIDGMKFVRDYIGRGAITEHQSRIKQLLGI